MASKVIQTSTYVDDLVRSSENEKQRVEVIQDIIQVFGCGGYFIHKFCSNSKTVMDSIPDGLKCDLSSKPIQKILSCSWNLQNDTLIYPWVSEEKSVKSKKGLMVPDHVMTR